MDLKKLAPWNWFKKEEEERSVPANRAEAPVHYGGGAALHPVLHLQREMDRLFEHAFRGFGLPSLRSDFFTPLSGDTLLKPQVDVGATDKEYNISVEVPGVDEKDVKVEITDNTMTIRGEKKQEKEEKDKNYYRVERSYGSFQRVLSLPEDADKEAIKAVFKKGILTITMPRKPLPKADVRQIDIKSADE